MFNPNDKLWTEKYRPSLKEFCGADIKEKITPYLAKPELLPNFIFESKMPGSGKTSLVKAMIQELGCDTLTLNSAEDRSIDVLPNKVKKFIAEPSTKLNLKKCIFLDEADSIVFDVQNMLKPLLEIHSDTVFFMLTCNRLNYVIEPIRDRCIIINFSYPNKQEVLAYMENICIREELDYTDEGLNELMSKLYPSMRKMILYLQDLKTRGLALIPDNINPNQFIFEELYKQLLDKDWQAIKDKVLCSDVNPRELNGYYWTKAVESSNIRLMQLTNLNERDISQGADSKIVFVTSLLEMVK
jgi:DNA polymerase III delta prime subunit